MEKVAENKELNLNFLQWAVQKAVWVLAILLLLAFLFTICISLGLNLLGVAIDAGLIFENIMNLLPIIAALALIAGIWAQIGSTQMPSLTITTLEFFYGRRDTIDYVIQNPSTWAARNVCVVLETGNYRQEENIELLDVGQQIEIRINKSFEHPKVAGKVRDDIIALSYEPVNHPELRVEKRYLSEITYLPEESKNAVMDQPGYHARIYAVEKSSGRKYPISPIFRPIF